MRHRLRAGLTYANVLSTLALFVALGGASYAAVTLPRNSVGAAQLRPNAVTAAKLGFALASKASVVAGTVTAPGSSCGGTGSGPSPPCAAPAPIPVASASVAVKGRANLLVIATTLASSTGAATLQLSGVVDHGHSSSPGSPTSSIDLSAGKPQSGFFAATYPNVSAGRHTVELLGVSDQTPVGMTGTQLTVVALPPSA
jgi:hypothetical protein